MGYEFNFSYVTQEQCYKEYLHCQIHIASNLSKHLDSSLYSKTGTKDSGKIHRSTFFFAVWKHHHAKCFSDTDMFAEVNKVLREICYITLAKRQK